MKKIIISLFYTAISFLSITAQDFQSITNGFPIQIEEAPYQVSLYYKGSHHCGGSIINNRYILTAAHCVYGKGITSFTVNAGFTLQDERGSNIQSFSVKRIVHPKFNNKTLDFDVAVIEIDGTFTFNNFVQPIELISNNTIAAEAVGNEARVSGWGWTIPGDRTSASNQLQAVDVPIISNDVADGQLDISDSDHPELTQRMISTGAGGIDRGGACHKDSGGPLVVQLGQANIQIGIVSWGVPGCVGRENSPSIYARISELVDWIDEQVWDFASIEGDHTICSSSTLTYTIQNIPDFMTVYNWETSSNLEIVSSDNSSIVVSSNTGTRAQGFVIANFGNIQIKKDVWVGKPASPTSISGYEYVTYGAMVNYLGSNVEGATSYEWYLPYPYNKNATVSVSPKQWGILSGSKQLTAIVGPKDGLVQYMGVNKCGKGGAKSINVVVTNKPTDGKGSSGNNGGNPVPQPWGGNPVPQPRGGGNMPKISSYENDVANKVEVFPNPASAEFIVQSDFDSMSEIQLFDLKGKLVYTKILSQSNETVKTSHLSNGIYFLQVKGEVNETKKVIIKH